MWCHTWHDSLQNNVSAISAKIWPPYQKSNKTTTNKIQKQRSATHCDVRHGTSCCDVRRADGSRGSSFSGDSYKSIAFCNIRGGGRGSGGVILYEKNMATDLAPVILPSKRKKYSTSPTTIGAFRRRLGESIAMLRRRIGHKYDHHREYYKN